jgi:small subunit ribosomal protein S16
VATRIRLRRTGKKKQAYYRVVVADSRSPRDGRFIEILGNYNPNSNPARIEIDEERSIYWLKNGAQPSDTVRSLLSKKGILAKLAEEMPGHATLKRPPKKSKAVMESRQPAVQEEKPETGIPVEAAEEVEEAPAEAGSEEVTEESADKVAEEEKADEEEADRSGDETEE